MRVTGGSGDEPPRAGPSWLSSRTLLAVEVGLVLALSLGRSAVYAVIAFGESLAAGGLSTQHAVMNGSLAPGMPWLDLALQLLAMGFSLVPVALAGYLMARSGSDVVGLWFGGSREVARDVVRGLGVASVVGGAGLLLYLGAVAVGVNRTVVAEQLPHAWWRVPVLCLSALTNALLEETVMIGYLLVRLQQMHVSRVAAVSISATIRGAYHLYQGLGGFVGNLVMGLIFGWLHRRWGRVTPLIVAHTVLDVVAFVGYALLIGQVSWLPR